jgi:hypothetical protein
MMYTFCMYYFIHLAIVKLTLTTLLHLKKFSLIYESLPRVIPQTPKGKRKVKEGRGGTREGNKRKIAL